MTQLTHADYLPVLDITKELLDVLMPFQSEKTDIGTGLLLPDSAQSRLASMRANC